MDGQPQEQKTDVNIASESGVRIVDRRTETERNVVNTHIGSWPEDSPSQRVWCLSLVSHNRPNFKDDLDFEAMFEEAEKIRDWVITGRTKSKDPQ